MWSPMTLFQGQYDSGIISDISVPANSNTVVTVTFNKAFSQAPQVVASLTRAYGDASVIANLAINVVSTGATSANITVYNNTSEIRSGVGVRWIAVG